MKQVLLVEDECITRMLVSEYLTTMGFSVIEADNGDSALFLLESCAPDLLVTDLNLGAGPSGRDVARSLRQRYPDTPIVFASAYPPEAADNDPPLCIRGFLTKPYGSREVQDVVGGIFPMAAMLLEPSATGD